MERRTRDSEDWQLPSTRRSTGFTEPFRTYEASVIEHADCYQDSARTHYTPLSDAAISARDRSQSPISYVTTGTLRTFQHRIRALEGENRHLKQTIRDLEDRSRAENDSWKRKLMSEISISKSRELDLISRFNAVERLVKAEAQRVKETELLYKNSETALLIRLDQTNADAEALEAKLRLVTRELEEIKEEKEALEQVYEEKTEELEATRKELVSVAEELKRVYGEKVGLREDYADTRPLEGENRPANEEASSSNQQGSEPFLVRYLREPPPAPHPLRSASSPLLQTSEPAVTIPFGPVLSTPCPRVNFPPFTAS